MKVLKLPVLPNSPVLYNSEVLEGEFLLKKFGSFEFVKNVRFDSSLIKYDENYQNNQGDSLVFRTHMNKVYSLIKSKFVKGSRLIEVGCGKGAFLEIVKEDGYFDYAGYDAAYEGGDEKIHSRYLTEEDSLIADVIVLRHTLEHVESPYKFLKLLNKIFNSDALIFIEVPQFEWIENNKVLFDFTYEHVNYFTTRSLCSLFSKVLSYGDLFNGQYQFCLAKLDSISKYEWEYSDIESQWSDYEFDGYIDRFLSDVKFLDSCDRIWVWGGATKGVLFLKYFSELKPHGFEKVVSVVDINEKKQSLFTPSTNLKIISASEMFDLCCEGDAVLVMNPNYLNEVKALIEENVSYELEVFSF